MGLGDLLLVDLRVLLAGDAAVTEGPDPPWIPE